MDNRAIGIFDSGLGGLTAVKAIRQLLPNENIIYFADSGRVPYGSKSREELRLMTEQNMDFLLAQDIKLMVAACGTVSSNAASVLERCPVPAIGVVDCSARALAQLNGSAPLGIIATEASLRSGAYERALRELGVDRQIISCPCPDFVPLIESGHTAMGDELLEDAVERYLHEMKQAGITALLLGCTHFGIIADSIKAYLGESVELVSAADCVSRELKERIEKMGLEGGSGQEQYYTSGSVQSFREQAEIYMGRPVEQVEHRVLPEETYRV